MEDMNQIHLLKYILCNFIILLANWKNIQIGRIDQIQQQLLEIKRLSAGTEDILDKLDYLSVLLKLYMIRQEINKIIMGGGSSSSQTQLNLCKETPKNKLDTLLNNNIDEKTDMQQQSRVIERVSTEMQCIEQILKQRKIDEQIHNGIKLVYFNLSSIGYVLTKKQQNNSKFYFAEKAIDVGLKIEQLLKRYFLVEEMNLILYMLIQQSKQTMDKALITKAYQFISSNQEVLTLQNSKLEKISKKLDKLNKITNFFHKEKDFSIQKQSNNLSDEFKLKGVKVNKGLLKQIKKDQLIKSNIVCSKENNQSSQQINSNDSSKNKKSQELQISFSILNKKRELLKNNHLENNEFNIFYKKIDTARDSIEFRKNNSLSIKREQDSKSKVDLNNIYSLKSSIIIENKDQIINSNKQSDHMYGKVKELMKQQRSLKQPNLNNDKNQQQSNQGLNLSFLNEYANNNLTQDLLNVTQSQSSKTQQSSRFDIKSLTELDWKKINIDKTDKQNTDQQKLKQNTSDNKSEQDDYKITQNSISNKTKSRKIESACPQPNKTSAQFNNNEQQVNSQGQLSDLISRIKEAGKSNVIASHRSSLQLEQSTLNNTVSTLANKNNENDQNYAKKSQQQSQQYLQQTQSTFPCSSISSLSKIQSSRLQINRQKVSSCGKIVVFDEYQLSEKDISQNQPKLSQKPKPNNQGSQQQSSSSSIRIGEFQFLSETDVLPPPSENNIPPPYVTQGPLTSRNLKQRNTIFQFGPQSTRESKSTSRFDDQTDGNQIKPNECHIYNNFHHHKSQSLKIQKKHETSIQISQISSDYNYTKQDNCQQNQTNTASTYSSNQGQRSMILNQIELTSRPPLRNNLSRQSSSTEQKSFLLKQQSSLTSRNSNSRDKEIESYIFWKNVQSVSVEKELNKENIYQKKTSGEQDDESVSPVFNQLSSFMSGNQNLKKKYSIKEILSKRSLKNSINQDNTLQTVQLQSNPPSCTQLDNLNQNQTFSSQILQLNQNKLNSQSNNQNKQQNQNLNQNETKLSEKNQLISQKINSQNQSEKENQDISAIRLNKENNGIQINKIIKLDNQNSINIYHNQKCVNLATQSSNCHTHRSNSQNLNNDHLSSLDYFKNSLSIDPKPISGQRDMNLISRKQLFMKRNQQNQTDDQSKINLKNESLNIKEFLKNQNNQQKIQHQTNTQIEINQQPQSSLSQNIQNHLKVFSNMDRLKISNANRQMTIKEQEESRLITSSNFNFESLIDKQENQITNLDQQDYEQFQQKINENRDDQNIENSLQLTIKATDELNKSSLLELSDQTINELYSQKEDLGHSMDQFEHLNMSDNKLINLSQDQKTDNVLNKETDENINNKLCLSANEDNVQRNEQKDGQQDLAQKCENLQKIIVQTNNLESRENNYQIEITLTQESLRNKDKQIDLQKIKLHMNDKNKIKKKQNLVEQLQKNYNINSKEFLKKTILNNIQNKYFKDQNNKNNNDNCENENDERQNQIINRDKLDVDYSINPASSYMDQSSDRFSRFRRQFSNTMEVSQKNIQDNISNSNNNNSKKESEQYEDNCSIVNVLNSSFTNSLVNSDHQNNLPNQNNHKKSKYFKQSQNIQLKRVPSQISHVNNIENEEKDTMLQQSEERQQTRHSNQSFNLEEDYKNYPAFFNTINKNSQSKKLNRLKSYADMNSAQREYPEKFMNTNLQQNQQQIQNLEIQPILENRNDRSTSCFQMNEYNTPQNKKKPFEISLRRSPSLIQSPDFSKKISEFDSYEKQQRVGQFSQFYQKYSEQQQQQRLSGENQFGKQQKLIKSYQSLLRPTLQFSSKYLKTNVFVTCSVTVQDKLNQIVVQLCVQDNQTLRYAINYSPLQLLEDIQSPQHSQSETIWPLVNEYMERDLLKKYGVQIKYDFNNLVKSQQHELRITHEGIVLFTNNNEYQLINQTDKQGVIGIKSIVDSLFQDNKYIKSQQKLTGRVISLLNSKEENSSPSVKQLRKMNSVVRGDLKKQIYDSQEKKNKNKFIIEDQGKDKSPIQTFPISFIMGKKNQKYYFLSLYLQITQQQKDISKQKNINLDSLNLLIHLQSTKQANITQIQIPIKKFFLQYSNQLIEKIIGKIKNSKNLSLTQKQLVRECVFSQLEVSEDLQKIDFIDFNTIQFLKIQNDYQNEQHIESNPLHLLKEETQEDYQNDEIYLKFNLFNTKYIQLSKQLHHEKNVLNINGQVIQQDNQEIIDSFQTQSLAQKTSIIESEEQFNLNDYVKQRRTGIRSRYHQGDLVNINNYLKDKIIHLEFSTENSIKLNNRVIFILRKQINNETSKISTCVIMKKYSSYLNDSLLIYKTSCKRAVQLFNMAYTTKSKQQKMNLHSLVFRNQTNNTFFLSHSFNRNLQYHYQAFYTSPVPFQALPSIPILKTMLLKNSPHLSKIFFVREVKFLERTERLGKVVVKMIVYQNYHDLFTSITINDYSEKMKEYNIILSKFDIEMVLNRQLKESFKYISKEKLIEIARNLLSCMYFDNNFIYKLLKINYDGKSYKNSFDQLQYYNSQKQLMKERNTPNNLNNQRFLQRDYKMVRTILHQVAIHNNDYTIVTIQRHLHFDAFLFNLYFPKSSRKIRAYLTLNELKELSQVDMRQILREITHRFSIFDQRQFSFQDYLSNCAKSLNSKLQYRPSFNLDCAINQSNMQYNVSKELKEFDKFSKERNRKVQNIFEISSHKMRNTREKFDKFKEFRIWEKILGLIQVVLRGEQYFIEIGSSVVIPTIEYLSSQIITIDSSEDCYCAEYYLSSRISNSSSNSASMSRNLPTISYSNSEEYDLLIRFFQFGQEKFIQKRLNSRSLLNFQVADGFFKDQANYSQSKILLCDLYQLTYFISFKIFNLDFPEIQSHLPLSKNNCNSSSSQLMGKRNIMRRLVYLLVDEDKYHQNKFKAQENNTHTEVLCSNPQTLVTYSFCPGEKQVRITLYLPKQGQQYFSQIYFTELEQSIPLFQVEYNSCIYQNLFRQISILYKQQLINSLNMII